MKAQRVRKFHISLSSSAWPQSTTCEAISRRLLIFTRGFCWITGNFMFNFYIANDVPLDNIEFLLKVGMPKLLLCLANGKPLSKMAPSKLSLYQGWHFYLRLYGLSFIITIFFLLVISFLTLKASQRPVS